jgi:hypothetical protein
VPLSIAVATPIAQLHECIAVGATKLHVDTKIIAMSTVFVSKHGVVKGIPLSTPIVDIIKPLRDVRSDVFRNPLSPTQRTLLLGVGHVLGLQTLETNEVRAFDVDDLGADVLFNALDADGALGVGRVGGVRVWKEVGVGCHEGVETRGGRCWVRHVGVVLRNRVGYRVCKSGPRCYFNRSWLLSLSVIGWSEREELS